MAVVESRRGFVYRSLMFLFVACALMANGSAQTGKLSKVPDAQIESNVLQALAADPLLAKQTISTASVFGTVTLTGSVPDEATRTLAEQTVARTAGVVKVIDELALSPAGTAETEAAPIERGQTADATAPPAPAGDPSAGSNPDLQSDGTVAAPQNSPHTPAQPDRGTGPEVQHQTPGVADNYPPPVPSQDDPATKRPDAGVQAGSVPPPPGNYPPPTPYGRAPSPGQRRNGPAAGGTREQLGGAPVTVPASTTLQIRISQGLSSRDTPAGATFGGTVLYDVLEGGYIAIPRGAQVSGVVRNATTSGVLKGRGELALELTTLDLAGERYPLVTDTWVHAGGDKTLCTVNSAVGLGALGAILGGVAGGGAGAAIGAGVGSAAGIGASAASQGGQVVVPPEGILTFHLTQPAQLHTVSQAELNRLGAGRPYARRYPYPPPPYAYGPRPYGYPGYYASPYPLYPRFYRRY